MVSNRRIQERFSLNLKARIWYRHQGEETPVFDTVAANISAGGVFLNTSEPIRLASKVQMEFYLNVEDLQKLKFILSTESLKNIESRQVWVTTSGIVIRQEDDGVGVIFDTDHQITPLNPAEKDF